MDELLNGSSSSFANPMPRKFDVAEREESSRVGLEMERAHLESRAKQPTRQRARSMTLGADELLEISEGHGNQRLNSRADGIAGEHERPKEKVKRKSAKSAASLVSRRRSFDSENLSMNCQRDASPEVPDETKGLESLSRDDLIAMIFKNAADKDRQRASAQRWRRKFDQETQVNAELARRLRESKREAKRLRTENETMQRIIDSQRLIPQVSPVSSIGSPYVGPVNEMFRNHGNFAAPICLSSSVKQEQGQGQEQQKSKVTVAQSKFTGAESGTVSEELSFLSVEVDFEGEGSQGEDSSLRDCNRLFSHFFIIERESAKTTFCWPPEAERTVPDSVPQFCFPNNSSGVSSFDADEKPLEERVFIFVLSGGEQNNELKRGQDSNSSNSFNSCLSSAIFGICLPSPDDLDICFCMLSQHPYFELHSQVLVNAQRTFSLGGTEALVRQLLALDSDMQSIPNLPIGPGQKLTLTSSDIEWAWPRSCSTQLELISKWGMQTLLQCLPLDQVLFIVGCLLLELKVVVVSGDLPRLSSSTLR